MVLANLTGLAKSHPALAFKIGAILFTDPALEPDLVALEKGTMTVKAFALAQQPTVEMLVDLVTTTLKADPTLFPAILTVICGS